MRERENYERMLALELNAQQNVALMINTRKERCKQKVWNELVHHGGSSLKNHNKPTAQACGRRLWVFEAEC
jgi:hypothetical protein